MQALDDAEMVMPARDRQPSPIYIESGADSASNVVELKPRRGKRIVFGWYVGKFSHLDWLLPFAAHVTPLLRAIRRVGRDFAQSRTVTGLTSSGSMIAPAP